MPESKELLRLFRDPAEANAAAPKGRVVVPHSTIDGWTGVIIHDAVNRFVTRYDVVDIDFTFKPEVRELITPPKGIHVNMSSARKETGDIYKVGLDPFEDDIVRVVELVINDKGGIHVVVEIDDGVCGKKILGKLYPHDEAVIHFDL